MKKPVFNRNFKKVVNYQYLSTFKIETYSIYIGGGKMDKRGFFEMAK